MINSVKGLITKHEGLRLKPYTDSTGHLTIGVGRNLTDVGISTNEALDLLQNDVDQAESDLTANFRPFEALDQVRQAVLLDMCFNLGWPKLSKFTDTLEAVTAGDFSGAAAAMLQSEWAIQVGPRATELAQMMISGEWPNS
jgi:lysozyme